MTEHVTEHTPHARQRMIYQSDARLHVFEDIPADRTSVEWSEWHAYIARKIAAVFKITPQEIGFNE